jgi:hypothetical protein
MALTKVKGSVWNPIENGVADAAIDLREFGAVSNDGTKDTQAMIDAISEISTNGGILVIPDLGADYILESTITATYAGKPFTIQTAADAILASQVGAGVFAFDFINLLFCQIHLAIESSDSTANGIRVRNSNPAAATNSLYNMFSGRIQNQGGRSATKPALGSGSVGIQFDEVNAGSGGSNYFNHLQDGFRVRGYDTAIRLKDNANANKILNPQIESYWYGIDIDSDENYIDGGFCHAAAGIDASNLTEAFYMRDNRNYNRIHGLMIEPGAFASVGTIGAGNDGHHIDITDNSGYGIVNNGDGNNGEIDKRLFTSLLVINYPATAHGSYFSATRTVSGAKLGDLVEVTNDTALPVGSFLIAEVTAADSVGIRLFNMSGASISPTVNLWLRLTRT